MQRLEGRDFHSGFLKSWQQHMNGIGLKKWKAKIPPAESHTAPKLDGIQFGTARFILCGAV